VVIASGGEAVYRVRVGLLMPVELMSIALWVLLGKGKT
jgi:hypothetical protein